MAANSAPAEDIPYTDPELLETLTDEQRALLTAKTWREPRNTSPFFSAQAARELDLDFVTALRLDKEHFVGSDFSQHEMYLRPTRDAVRSPEETVAGMQDAAAFLVEQIRAGEKVAVFADYDVDGTTSARVFNMALADAGAADDQVIRAYASGSFGLTRTFVQEAADGGAAVLVTLDCGSNQTDAVEFAQSLGMKVIVVDHHEVDLSNPADFHLNPQFIRARTEAAGGEAIAEAKEMVKTLKVARDQLLADQATGNLPGFDTVAQARKLAERAAAVKTSWMADPDNEQTKAELEQMKAEVLSTISALDEISGAETPSRKLDDAIRSAHNTLITRELLTPELETAREQMIARLDEISGAETQSRTLDLAIERARIAVSNLHHDPNTGAQLSWKFGQAMLEQAHGEAPESWYAQPMYLAGLGALADMAPMGTSKDGNPPARLAIENRAFVRVPVDEAKDAPPAPAGLRLLAKHFDEDLSDPASLVRTRAALNLPKRMPSVDAGDVVGILSAATDKQALPRVEKLLDIYEDATDKKNVMKDVGNAYWEDYQRKAKTSDADQHIMFAVVDDPQYEAYSGQSGTLANSYIREHRKTSVVFVSRELELPDDTGTTRKLVKWSARTPTKVKFTELKDDQAMADACTVPVQNEDGSIEMRATFGGHLDIGVVSGSCTVDKIGKVQEVFEKFAARQEAKNPGCWRVRQRDSVWVSKRLVPAERLTRLEQEAKLIAPATNGNYPTRISVAAKAKDIGPLDPDRKTHPATLVLTDGSERACDIAPEAVPALETGAYFETAISLGDRRYWIRDLAPIPSPQGA